MQGHKVCGVFHHNNMSRVKLIVLHFIVLFLVAQGRLLAWGNTWMGTALEQIVNSARGRVGTVRYTAAMQVANAGYDSDIYFGTLANPVPDYTFATGPDIHLFLPLKKKIVFDIFESPRYVFYLDTKREKALNNTFAGQVHFVFDRFYVQAGAGLINAKRKLSTELNINVRLEENTLNGLILCQVSKGASLALQYRRSAYNYENQTPEIADIGQNLNRTESYIDFIAYLQKHARTRFYLVGEYGSFMFAEAVSSFKNSRSYSAFGGVDFLPPPGGYEGETSGIRGSINIGYKRLNIIDPQNKDYSGLSGNADVSLGIIKFTALHIFAFKGPQFSAHSGRTYYFLTSYGAGLIRSLARNVLFTYDFMYSRNTYPAAGLADGVSSDEFAYRYTVHSLSLNFRLRKDLQLSLLTTLSRRNSQLALRPISGRSFIGFSLTYGYPSGGFSIPAGPILG